MSRQNHARQKEIVQTHGRVKPLVRSVFISDVHLGTRACQAESLLSFLKEHPTENLILVGDIIDLWAMRSRIFWPKEHNTLVQKVLRMARHGVNVIYVPGNHDEMLRDFDGVWFGDIRIEKEWIHVTAKGLRIWVVHGDQFDRVAILFHPWIGFAGDLAYQFLTSVNRFVSWIRRQLNLSGSYSLSYHIKRNLRSASRLIASFQEALLHETRKRGLDGVVCGHVHWSAIHQDSEEVYLNCGDWVDSCTAIVEHFDGRFEIVEWKLKTLGLGSDDD